MNQPGFPRRRDRSPALSLEVTYRDVGDLIPRITNPRIHSAKQIDQIARSIAQFGFLIPILTDPDGNVIAGHGRILGARQLGMASVPTLIVDHLTEVQKTAYLVADNKISLNASWDEQLLMQELSALAAVDLDFDLTVTGFEVAELDLILQGPSLSTSEPDEAPIELGPAITRVGELWALDAHRIFCGDALDPESYARLMGDTRAAVVFTDPPYNLKVSSISGLGRTQYREFATASGELNRREFTDFLRRAFELMAAHSTDGSIHFVCMDFRHIGELLAAGEAVYTELKNLCVWAKDTGGMGSLYRSQHELIFVFKAGKGAHQNHVQLGRFGRNRTNVWNYPSANSFSRSLEEGDLLRQHPTPKNVAMIADALMDVSSRGDVVLDPFLGSGSTLIAAERVGRIAYGMDLDPQYLDLAIRRYERATGKVAVNLTQQCTFAELEEQRGGDHA